MPDYNEKLQSNTFYHLFDRANGGELLFRSDENYRYFLSKFRQHTSSYIEVWAYCLLPNHFHFVIRTKTIEAVNASLIALESERVVDVENYHKWAMQAFSNFLNAYAKAYNKYYNRMGSLFIERIKRTKLDTKQSVINAIWYVHKNPVHHGYVPLLTDWNISSYKTIKNQLTDGLVCHATVLKLFDGIENFDSVHAQFIYKTK